jgi:uroporphyrin-III C-methyltransferase
VRRLQSADVVIYDRLILPEILECARACARRIDRSDCDQEEINALLVRLGRLGQRVVRLKGGDPFVFGRGGEEMLALAEARVPFEVVPGISAILGAPAAADIPVTHRGLSRMLIVTTATGGDGAELANAELNALATPDATIVIVMVAQRLSHLVEALLRRGRPATELAAVIQHATWPSEVVVVAPLGEIVERTLLVGIQAPAVLVAGPTVGMLETLKSFQRPFAAF